MSSVWYTDSARQHTWDLGVVFQPPPDRPGVFEGYTIGRLTVGPLSLTYVQIGIACCWRPRLFLFSVSTFRRTIERFSLSAFARSRLFLRPPSRSIRTTRWAFGIRRG